MKANATQFSSLMLSVLILLVCSQCMADNYWIPSVQRDGNLIYNVQVPDSFVPLLLTRTSRGGGESQTRTINGRQYTFVRQALAWTTGAPTNGQILLLKEQGKDEWQTLADLRSQTEFTTALEALGSGDEWSHLEFLWALRTSDATNPQLVVDPKVIDPYSTRVPRAALRDLSKDMRPGQFYSGVQIPANINAFRTKMLDIGNLGRRDPNFRTKHGEKVAIDLSGDSTKNINNDRVKIYKNHSSPPYFVDLVLNQKLCKAAQFQAEYQALTKKMGHLGPANYQGVDMRDFNDRVRHYGYPLMTAGEAAGGWDATAYPRKWMVSDTHFAPWFNVDADVREMGLGAAKANDGTWYFAAIGGAVTHVRLVNRSVGGGKVLADSGGRLTWAARAESDDQKWRLEAVADNVYQIVNMQSGKLFVEANSTAAKKSGRAGGAQLWELRTSEKSGYFEFMNPLSARRLGATATSGTSDAKVYAAGRNDQGGQWLLEITDP